MTCPICFQESEDGRAHSTFMGKPCPRAPKGAPIQTQWLSRDTFEAEIAYNPSEQHELEQIWEEEHSLKPKPTTRELAKEIVQRRRQVQALQKLWRRTPYLGDWKI